jgi:hypothetical protein
MSDCGKLLYDPDETGKPLMYEAALSGKPLLYKNEVQRSLIAAQSENRAIGITESAVSETAYSTENGAFAAAKASAWSELAGIVDLDSSASAQGRVDISLLSSEYYGTVRIEAVFFKYRLRSCFASLQETENKITAIVHTTLLGIGRGLGTASAQIDFANSAFTIHYGVTSTLPEDAADIIAAATGTVTITPLVSGVSDYDLSTDIEAQIALHFDETQSLNGPYVYLCVVIEPESFTWGSWPGTAGSKTVTASVVPTASLTE